MQYGVTKAILWGLFWGSCTLHAAIAQTQQKPVSHAAPLTTTTPIKPTHPQKIPLNLSTQHFGFFCRQELKMQKANIPITFRLGTMEQCNRLEQKPGYRQAQLP